MEENEIVLFSKESPEKGKVNRELINELSSLFKTRVEILSGFASRQKRVLILDASPEEVSETLSVKTDSKSSNQ